MSKFLFLIFFSFSTSYLKAQSDSTKSSKSLDSIPFAGKLSKAPSFPGGKDGFRTFIQKNLKKPKEITKAKNTKVLVSVLFIIRKDGTIDEIKVTEVTGGDSCPTCKQAAINVFLKIPKWTPGEKDGKPVDVYFLQKIIFTSPN